MSMYHRRNKEFNARLAARRDEIAGVDRKPRLNYWRCLGLAICLASAVLMLMLGVAATKVASSLMKPSPVHFAAHR
jgi:hypothetical protein